MSGQQPYYSGGQQPYYAGQQPPPYNQQPYLAKGTTTSGQPYYGGGSYGSTTGSPSPTLDSWIFWLCFWTIILDIYSLYTICSHPNWVHHEPLIFFGFVGTIYYILSALFSRKTSRVASIIIACLGFICAVVEFVILQLGMGYPPFGGSFCWFAIVIGILYSIKAHKLGARNRL